MDHGPSAFRVIRCGWHCAEGNAVYRLDLSKGTIHHEAGTGKRGFSGNGGPAKSATLSGPKGIALGPRGDVYLADTESHSVE